AETGHHFWDGLRQGDAPQSLSSTEVQRFGGFMLGNRHSLDGATHDFCAVGADIQAEGECAGDDRRQSQINAYRLSDQGQGEIKPEKLYEQGCTAEYFNKDDRHAFKRPV